LKCPRSRNGDIFFGAVRDVFVRIARTCSLLIVIDDLHWADPPTLLLLANLAQALHEARIVILAMYREESLLNLSSPLAATIEQLIRNRLAHSLTLKPLPKAGVAGMLQALSGHDPPAQVLDTFWQESGGNPFFVEEVFKHLLEEGKLFDAAGEFRPDLAIGEREAPVNVRLVIGRRLTRLGPQSRHAMGMAAVLGRNFDFKLLEELAGLDAAALLAALEESERAQLIRAAAQRDAAGYTFSHELIRQTLLADLPVARLQALHLQAARAIERLHSNSPDEYAPDLARHYYQAGPLAEADRAIPWMIRAGERALESAAFEEALRYFERARSLRGSDQRVRVDIDYKLGLAKRSLGRWEEALNLWDQALTSYERSGDTETAGHLCSHISHDVGWSGRFAEALKLAQRGLRLIGNRSTPDRCRMLAIAGVALCLFGNRDAGYGVGDESVAIAEKLKDEPLIGYSLYMKAISYCAYMHYRDAAEVGSRAVARLRGASDLWHLAGLLNFLASAHLRLGHFDELTNVSKDLESVGGRIGNFDAVLGARRFQDYARFAVTGDLAALLESSRNNLDLARRVTGQMTVAYGLTQLGLGEFWSGEWDQAAVHLKEGATLSPGGGAGGNWGCAAIAEACAGRKEEALRILREAGANLPCPGRPNDNNSWMAALAGVEVLAIAGERTAAASLYPLVLEAQNTGVCLRHYDQRLLHTVAGIAAAAGGRWQAAEGHYQDALQLAQRLPNRLERAEAQRFYAQMLLDRDDPGDREKARALLTDGIETYAQIGMPKHREMAQALLEPGGAQTTLAGSNVLRRDGEYWTVAYRGKTIRLRDTKGLGYLAHLLRNPAREIHVADLVAMVSDPGGAAKRAPADATGEGLTEARSLGNAGEMLDREAAREYRARIAELTEQIEKAIEAGDPRRAAALRREIRFVTAELASAYGIGGRPRRASDVDERVRKAVRNRITAAIQKIRDEHPILGQHLACAVRLGLFCLYLPDRPVHWSF
jgi:tetratricopeptide (TPR) repeat protein